MMTDKTENKNKVDNNEDLVKLESFIKKKKGQNDALKRFIDKINSTEEKGQENKK